MEEGMTGEFPWGLLIIFVIIIFLFWFFLHPEKQVANNMACQNILNNSQAYYYYEKDMEPGYITCKYPVYFEHKLNGTNTTIIKIGNKTWKEIYNENR